jgi:hypothetical protein
VPSTSSSPATPVICPWALGAVRQAWSLRDTQSLRSAKRRTLEMRQTLSGGTSNRSIGWRPWYGARAVADNRDSPGSNDLRRESGPDETPAT